MRNKRLSPSDQQFADRWAHLWEDAGEPDAGPYKPCLDIGSRYDDGYGNIETEASGAYSVPTNRAARRAAARANRKRGNA